MLDREMIDLEKKALTGALAFFFVWNIVVMIRNGFTMLGLVAIILSGAVVAWNLYHFMNNGK